MIPRGPSGPLFFSPSFLPFLRSAFLHFTISRHASSYAIRPERRRPRRLVRRPLAGTQLRQRQFERRAFGAILSNRLPAGGRRTSRRDGGAPLAFRGCDVVAGAFFLQ